MQSAATGNARVACNFLFPVMVDASMTNEAFPVRVKRRILGLVRSIVPEKAAPLGGAFPVPGFPDPPTLQPGDWVEVRPVDEILATLDYDPSGRGLRWMRGMEKFCGKKFRVFKRVETITFGATGESRKLKSPTVFLENAYCDGTCAGGCDRSCFLFWQETWLKKISEDEAEEPLKNLTAQFAQRLRGVKISE